MSTRQIMLNALNSGMFTFTRGSLKVTKEGQDGNHVCHCAMGALLEALEVPSLFDPLVYTWLFKYDRGTYSTYAPMTLIPNEVQQIITQLNDTSESYEPVIDYLESVEDWD